MRWTFERDKLLNEWPNWCWAEMLWTWKLKLNWLKLKRCRCCCLPTVFKGKTEFQTDSLLLHIAYGWCLLMQFHRIVEAIEYGQVIMYPAYSWVVFSWAELSWGYEHWICALAMCNVQSKTAQLQYKSNSNNSVETWIEYNKKI